MSKKNKAMTFRKYAEGTKKVKFKGLDSTDESFEKPTPNLPKLEAPEKLSSYSNKEVTKTSAIKLENKPKVREGEMEAVKKWQAKRGLVADGIWGKNTQAAYEKEQAAKKMNLKKSSITTPEVKADKYVKAKVTEAQPVSKPSIASGKKGSDGNVYFSNNRVMNLKTGKKGTAGDMSVFWDGEKDKDGSRKRGENVDANAWSKATSKRKESTEDSEAERYRRADSIAKQYGGPDEPTGGWVNKEAADEMSKIEQEGDSKAYSTAAKLGVPAGALAIGAIAYGVKKGKFKNADKTVSNLGKKVGQAFESSASKKVRQAQESATNHKNFYRQAAHETAEKVRQQNRSKPEAPKEEPRKMTFEKTVSKSSGKPIALLPQHTESTSKINRIITDKSIPSKKEVKNIIKSNTPSTVSRTNNSKNVDEAMSKAQEYKATKKKVMDIKSRNATVADKKFKDTNEAFDYVSKKVQEKQNKKKPKFVFDSEGKYLGKNKK